MKKIIVEGTPKEIREYENTDDGQLDKYLKTEPDTLTEPDTPDKKTLEYPDKITLPWLKEHVSIPQWFYLGGVILALFIGGVQASKLTLVKEIFSLEKCIENISPVNPPAGKKTPNKQLNKDAPKSGAPVS